MVQQGEPFQRLNVEQAKSLYDKQGEVWIDVREPAEWERGRIPGTKLVPLNTLLISPREHLKDADAVVFYCAQGIRSVVACEVAAAIGLSRIYNVEGGIIEWEAKGYPVER
ncbi:MAG: rhodanese-like domain-containing protein [Candidatus Methylomirabilales bacterium]